MPMSEARRNEEVIALADSQVLRWIDELNGMTDADRQVEELKRQIKILKKELNVHNSNQNSQNVYNIKRKIREKNNQISNLQFKPDYMCLIIDKPADYRRACKGFTINGIKYVRLLGTNGGIKNSTIVFVSERLAPELRRRIENDRNKDKPMVTAKLEAYKALACSASTPVSFPVGVLVVNDCETQFKSDYTFISEGDTGEPVMEERKDQDVKLNASDGFGLILPSLARRWSKELQLDYTFAGCNIRMSWTKGMLYAFDFREFAKEVADSYIVKDVWGNEVDVRNVEMILTTSMLKLWDSYESCYQYLLSSIRNGYQFCVTKTTPKKLEHKHNLNYQFIQPFKFTDEDIEELIQPTIQEIKDVFGGDWRKTVLFLRGNGLNDNNIDRTENDIAKAIMIDHSIVNDTYVRSVVNQAIKNRINEAKVGVIGVHGNYSIASGDPYSLCQNMFGLEVTGLLKAGEVYNKYWADDGAQKVLCFRAPMSTAENIVAMRPAHNDKINHWYQYMNTCTIFNSWDCSMNSLNGMDKSLSLITAM